MTEATKDLAIDLDSMTFDDPYSAWRTPRVWSWAKSSAG